MHPKGYYPPEFRKLAEQSPAIWEDDMTDDDWSVRHSRLSRLLVWAAVLGFSCLFWVALFLWWTQ